LFGKGIYIVSKAFAKAIRIAYRNYQESQRVEEERKQYYRGIYEESRVAGRGWAQGVADVRKEERERRGYERYTQKYPRNIERVVYGNDRRSRDIESFVFGDDSPRRKKKRRQFFDY
jgi:hypothetical protein